MYDVIVIGARCAGASTAMLLGRRGYRVLLIDKSRVGQNIPQGHFIHRLGPQRLEKWGVLDQVVATGCPLVSNVTQSIRGVALHGTDLIVDGVPFGFGPRRGALDQILVENAVNAGVEIRDQFVADDFLFDEDRMVGFIGRDLRTGRRSKDLATIVIGADGRHSKLAQSVNAPTYDAVPSVSCYYFSYWMDVSINELEMHIGSDFAIFAFPTHDNLLALFVGWPIERFHEVRTDLETHFMAIIDQVPSLAERVRGGERVEKFYGTADLPNFFRKPFGNGWALVGDAGHHKDPFMALGIADALRDAELIAQAIEEGLNGIRPFDEALAIYEQQRNAAAGPLYYENLSRARFIPPPPEARQLRQALAERGDQESINEFFKAAMGLIPPETFFNPENLSRLMSHGATEVVRG